MEMFFFFPRTRGWQKGRVHHSQEPSVGAEERWWPGWRASPSFCHLLSQQTLQYDLAAEVYLVLSVVLPASNSTTPHRTRIFNLDKSLGKMIFLFCVRSSVFVCLMCVGHGLIMRWTRDRQPTSFPNDLLSFGDGSLGTAETSHHTHTNPRRAQPSTDTGIHYLLDGGDTP